MFYRWVGTTFHRRTNLQIIGEKNPAYTDRNTPVKRCGFVNTVIDVEGAAADKLIKNFGDDRLQISNQFFRTVVNGGNPSGR